MELMRPRAVSAAASSLGTLLHCSSAEMNSCLWRGHGPDSVLSTPALLGALQSIHHDDTVDLARTRDHMRFLAVPFDIGISAMHVVGASGNSAINQSYTHEQSRRRLETVTRPPLNWCNATMNPLGKSVCAPVRSQRSCGSCWAFASVAALETTANMFTSVPKLSAQQLLDCSRGNYSAEMKYCWLTPRHTASAPWLKQRMTWHAFNDGCNGGLPFAAFEYARRHGLQSELSRPYTSANLTGGRCDSVAPPVVSVTNWAQAMGGNCNTTTDASTLLQDALETSPVAVSIVSSGLFTSYKGGLYLCPDDGIVATAAAVDHAMVLVGYDYDPVFGLYWILQNSYGEDWGERGFMRLVADNNLNCGLNLLPIAIGAMPTTRASVKESIDGNEQPWDFGGLNAAAWIAVLVTVTVFTLGATIVGVLRAKRTAELLLKKPKRHHLVL
ncbi:cysteine protease family C01A [Achlya hypogyna]|uniref:Cysteine protease family C01A n=1 Tax=Achlya hypogyna TaxID=1202772 RepID=A0A1V9YQZ3_ACHHY|nr:cysteine protease family C01A [Achlya hypogyna]